MTYSPPINQLIQVIAPEFKARYFPYSRKMFNWYIKEEHHYEPCEKVKNNIIFVARLMNYYLT